MKLPAAHAVKVSGLIWHVIGTRGRRDAPVVRLDGGGHYPYVVCTRDYVATLEQALGIA